MKNAKKIIMIAAITISFGVCSFNNDTVASPNASEDEIKTLNVAEASASTEELCELLKNDTNLYDMVTNDIPDEVKLEASCELGSASRTEYLQYFLEHGYVSRIQLGL